MKARRTSLLAAVLFGFAAMTGPAHAMQPPGEPGQDRFGCVDGTDEPVAGHPGAAGLAGAAPRVAGLTGNPSPTAWNAVHRADPIELGGC